MRYLFVLEKLPANDASGHRIVYGVDILAVTDDVVVLKGRGRASSGGHMSSGEGVQAGTGMVVCWSDEPPVLRCG